MIFIANTLMLGNRKHRGNNTREPNLIDFVYHYLVWMGKYTWQRLQYDYLVGYHKTIFVAKT